MDDCKILVVDDTPTNLFYFSEILSDEFDVDTANCGEDAMDKLESFRPDIVFLDIMMPGIDGYEVCRRIRKNPDLGDTRVIMVSARNETRDRIAGYDAGADDYICKPFNEKELRQKLDAYLRVKPANEVDRLKSDVAMLINHETRTPLNGLVAPLEMLLAEHDRMESSDRKSLLEIMHRSVTRLLALSRKSLLAAEIRSGDYRFGKEILDLNDVIDGVFDSNIAEANEKAVAIRFSSRHSGKILAGDEQLFFMVNALVHNAIRLSEPGAFIEVQTYTENSSHVVRVIDSGPGIEEGLESLVFQFFGRAHSEKYADGQSLSLYIAKNMAQLHGGDLDFETGRGIGASFSLSLPCDLETPVSH